jgi:cobalamin biosynthesis Mg chelatase CobN
MAANTKKPAKSMQEQSVVAMKQAPVTAVKPSGKQMAMAQAIQTRPKQTPGATTQMAENRKPKMPSTASPIPLFGLIGLWLVGVGAALGIWRRVHRVS